VCAVLCHVADSGALGTMLPNSHAGVGSGFNMPSGLMVPPVGTAGMVSNMQWLGLARHKRVTCLRE